MLLKSVSTAFFVTASVPGQSAKVFDVASAKRPSLE
jgi:hypothetical protein